MAEKQPKHRSFHPYFSQITNHKCLGAHHDAVGDLSTLADSVVTMDGLRHSVSSLRNSLQLSVNRENNEAGKGEGELILTSTTATRRLSQALDSSDRPRHSPQLPSPHHATHDHKHHDHKHHDHASCHCSSNDLFHLQEENYIADTELKFKGTVGFDEAVTSVSRDLPDSLHLLRRTRAISALSNRLMAAPDEAACIEEVTRLLVLMFGMERVTYCMVTGKRHFLLKRVSTARVKNGAPDVNKNYASSSSFSLEVLDYPSA